MWRSDEGVAPYRCLCQPKHPDKPKFECLNKQKAPQTSEWKPVGQNYFMSVALN